MSEDIFTRFDQIPACDRQTDMTTAIAALTHSVARVKAHPDLSTF